MGRDRRANEASEREHVLMIQVMDASAQVAWIRREPGAEMVESLLIDPANSCLAHGVNVCEVYYGFWRAGGISAADAAVRDLYAAGIALREDLDTLFLQEAARIRAVYGVPFADSFCVALARRVQGELVTADRKDFAPVASLGLCTVRFIW